MEYSSHDKEEFAQTKDYIVHIRLNNFKLDTNKDVRFKRINLLNGKPFTNPSQIVIRPDYPDEFDDPKKTKKKKILKTGTFCMKN